MSLQEVLHEQRRRRPVSEWPGSWSTSAGQCQAVYTYTGTTSTAEDEQYNPDMVDEILRADAAPPEAKFNNVVDMLDWLNRN